MTNPLDPTRPPRRSDHRCRTDDLAYPNVWEWYLDHVGRVPITMAHALSQYRKQHKCTFAEAFTALVDRGAIVLIDPKDRPQELHGRTRRCPPGDCSASVVAAQSFPYVL